jgi:hypothetical protein
MAQGRYREAAMSAGREGDELLRHLDRGLALFYAGDHRASNLYFSRAEQLAEERYTRSLTRAALSLLLNDKVLPYQPDPYERLLVHFYRGLNYVSAGERADVRVEARRLAALLLERRDRHPERAAREGDAFLAYLAGVLLEWSGETEEANVAYRNAFESYSDSTLAVTVSAIGAGEGERIHGALGAEDWRRGTEQASIEEPLSRAGWGELAIIIEGGFVVPPVEEILFLFLTETDFTRSRVDALGVADELAKRAIARRSTWEKDDEDFAYLLPVAFPVRRHDASAPESVMLEAAGRSFEIPLGLDVSRTAVLAYEADLLARLAKAAVRALVKTLTFKEATKDKDLVVRIAANALHALTERADTRAWLTLPREIRFLRLPLPPGRHDLVLRYGLGGSARLEVPDVKIGADRLTIVTARYY